MKKHIYTLLIAGSAAFVGTMSHAANYNWTNGASTMSWNATDTNWDAGAGNVAWADNNAAIFGATGAGAITVYGTQTVTGLTVSAAGYSLSGGQINLGSATTGFAINNDISISSVIGGTNALTKTGTGNLTLSGSNSYTGNTTISAGRVILGSGSALGTTAGSTTVSNGAALNVNGQTISENLTLSGSGVSSSGAMYNTSTTTAVLNGVVNAGGGTIGGGSDAGGYTISSLNIASSSTSFNTSKNSTINGLSGAGDLIKWNSATLTLGGSNTSYTGIITINSNTIKLANANALGASANATQLRRFNDTSRGTLDVNGYSTSENLTFEDSGTAGTTLGYGGFLTNNSTTDATVSGTIVLNKNGTIGGTGNLTASNVISGTGSLTKSGAGTLTLGGLNTYTGNTTLSAGTLILADNSQSVFMIGSSGVNNQFNGTGILTLDGDFSFDLTSAGTTLGDSWNIVTVGTLTETFGVTFSVANFFSVNSTLWAKSIGGGKFYNFDETTGGLSVTTVPEPSTWALLCGGLMVVLFLRKRRTC